HAIEIAIVEERDRIACVLQIDDPHRSPARARRYRHATLVHESYERPIPKPRQPGRRSGIAARGDRTPDPARIGRPAPERTVNRVAKYFEQFRRLLGIHRTETEAMHIELRTAAPRKTGPVAIDLPEQSARGIGAIARFDEQRQPTGKIGI